MRSSDTGAESKPVVDGRRIEATLVLLILGVEGTFFHPGQWNQNAKLAATVAFVEPGTPYTGTFRIDGLKDSARLSTGDWAESRGAFYSNKAPGVSLLGIVPYFLLYHAERSAGRDPTTLALTEINAFALNLWISVFWNVVAALALLRRLPRLGVHSSEGAAVVAVVYSFATLVLPFGCSAWGHSTAAAGKCSCGTAPGRRECGGGGGRRSRRRRGWRGSRRPPAPVGSRGHLVAGRPSDRQGAGRRWGAGAQPPRKHGGDGHRYCSRRSATQRPTGSSPPARW